MAKAHRKTVDLVFVLLGTALTGVFLVMGTLAWWGSNFATTNVRNELKAQKIYFPAKGSPSFSEEEYPDLQQYAGQQVDDGIKAKAYANGYIGRHLEKIAGGKTYAEVSTEALKDPGNETLQKQKQSLFQGETLRGLLLGSAYVNWIFGQIAMVAAVVSFGGAVIMGLLVLLGFRHMIKS